MASGDREDPIPQPQGVFSTQGLISRVELARSVLVSLINEPICYDISEDVKSRITNLKDRFNDVRLAYVDLQRRYTYMSAHPRVVDDLQIQLNELCERTKIELSELRTACQD